MASAAARPPVALTRAVFESPLVLVASALGAAIMVGALLTEDVQLGVALLAGFLYLPLALLNLPLAIAMWIPLVYLESWPAARFVPWGVGILLALAWLGTLGGANRVASEVTRRHRGVFLMLFLFLSWVTVSLAWAADPVVGAQDLWVWFMAGAILVVVSTSLSTRRHIFVVCCAFVVAAIISVFIALPQLSTEVAPGQEAARLGGSFQNPNYLAAGLLSAAVLATGLYVMVERLRTRLLLIGAIAVIAFALFTTGSRGGLVAAAVAAVAAIFVMRGNRLKLGALLAIAAVVGGVWAATASDSAIERVREFDTGGSGRVDLWSVAWRMTEDHALIGVGFENFPVEAPRYLSTPGQLERVDLIVETPKAVHNAYLGLLAETGVVGLGLFVILVGSLVRVTWQAANAFEELGDARYAALARSVLVAQIGGVAALFFSENPANHPLWILFALGPVLLTVASRSEAAR